MLKQHKGLPKWVAPSKHKEEYKMLRELIHDKINEIFAEYQKANNITSGDIDPFDAYQLDVFEDRLAEIIERACLTMPKAINYDDFTPSWYIYTDYEGVAHSETYGQITPDQFFTKVSRRICFDDINDETVQKIYLGGKEVVYAGWQPGMKYEYKDLDGNTVWVGYFPEWDH
jgi:hypothetical protein